MNTDKFEEKLRQDYDIQGRSPEVKICCPACSESRYRFGINTVKIVGHCFNCGFSAGGWRLLEFLGYEDEAEEFSKVSLTEEDLELQIKKALFSEERVLELPPELEVSGIRMTDYIKWKNPAYKDIYDLTYRYLQSRNFVPEEIAKTYDLILPRPDSWLRERIVIPVYEDKKLVYFQARSLTNALPKYLNPRKECSENGKSNFVFNLDKIASKNFRNIVICEGIFSAMSVGLNGVAIFGKDMSDVQAAKIMSLKIDHATIMLDPGAELESVRAAMKLYPRISVSVARLRGGDPNEVPETEVKRALEESVYIDDYTDLDSQIMDSLN